MPGIDPSLEPLTLASASPRRHEILTRLGHAFRIDPADVDETPVPGLDAKAVAIDLARRKARHVARRQPVGTVIGADTIVVLGDQLLGKPADAGDARRILTALSDSTHRVITGVALVHASGAEVADAAVTRVTMRPMSAAEIDAYIASGECFGKAGAYAIQERADRFVTALDGAYDNVVGFPSGLFARLLIDLTRRVAVVPGKVAGDGGGV